MVVEIDLIIQKKWFAFNVMKKRKGNLLFEQHHYAFFILFFLVCFE